MEYRTLTPKLLDYTYFGEGVAEGVSPATVSVGFRTHFGEGVTEGVPPSTVCVDLRAHFWEGVTEGVPPSLCV